MAQKVSVNESFQMPDAPEAERLTNEILDVILSLAALDFTKTVRVGYEDSNFNAVAAGLNMLGQELQRSVVSKQYVDNILSSMSDALIVVNPDQTMRTISEYASGLLEYSAGELIGQPFSSIVKSDLEWLNPENGVLFKKGELHLANVAFQTKSHREIPMQINAAVMTNSAGEMTGAVIVARDMRETLRLIKAAEDAAIAEKKKSAELQNEIQHRKQAEAQLQHAHDNLEQQVTERTQDLRKTNVLLNLEIEERKRAEAEVRAREQKYRGIFEATSVSMWELDFSKLLGVTDRKPLRDSIDLIEVLDVNEASVAMFEAESKAQLLKGLSGIFVDETLKTLEDALAQWTNGNRNFNSETVAKTLKGQRINTVLQLRMPGPKSEKQHVSMSIVNVTDQRELEQQLKQSQKMEAIGRLAGGVAHDFNNLLTVILNYAQMVVEDTDASNPNQKKVQAIIECGERAAALTSQLLAFSRRQIIEPKVINLNVVLGKMESMLKRLLGEDILLSTHMSDDIGMVKADVSQIEQIMMNLAVNSRDAMPDGGKLIIETKNVDLSGAYPAKHPGIEPGNYVMFAVSDTGQGMDEAVRSKIFEPFFTTKGVGKGTGLGLSTVYGNVKQNGGHIWVYSEVGIGTVFKIYLPRLAQSETVKPVEAVGALEHAKGHEIILVVEDEASVREVACDLLKRSGYDVLEAPNGAAALELSEKRKERIDLLLTDVVMPNMNGRALADKLIPTRPGIKVLFMSGYTDIAITQTGILDHKTAFLQKPFIPKTLLGKVREVLDAPMSSP